MTPISLGLKYSGGIFASGKKGASPQPASTQEQTQ